MQGQDVPRDWEKEYLNTFTKKVPFPTFKYEISRLNPAAESIVYTMTNVSIPKELKFQLFMPTDTFNQVNEIKSRLTEETKTKGKQKVEEQKDIKKSASSSNIKTDSDKPSTPLNPVNSEPQIVEDLTELALQEFEINKYAQAKEESKKLFDKKEAERKKKEEGK